MINAILGAKSRLSGRAVKPPSPGLYHYSREGGGEKSRVHLRIDPGSSKQDILGTLFVNANRILHLNSSATFMAFLVLEGTPDYQAVQAITDRFRVSSLQASNDYAQFKANLLQLTRPDGACPVCDLEVDITPAFSSQPSAPYRMDLALTYRCNDDCSHCYNSRPRDYPEFSTDQWKIILDRLWEIGIPHVVFTGGEPTLRNDLPELVSHAEHNGQITGLNTNGRRLSDAAYLHKLVNAGLDHIQVTVESHDPSIHDSMVRATGAWKQTIAGLRNALDSPLFVMTNTTMLRQNSPYLGETLDFLAALGVPTIGLNALIYSGHGLTVGTGLSEKELSPLLNLAKDKTSAHHQRLIWYTPTQYCHFDPMQLELGIKGCTAALYNMCIEPDGAVLPCQSYYQPVGNILQERWEAIWNHDLCLALRERHYVDEECLQCVLLVECGGGCPLTLKAHAQNLINLANLQ